MPSRRMKALLALGIPAAFAIFFLGIALAPIGGPKRSYIKVVPGDTWSGVFARLERASLLRSAFWAARYASLTGAVNESLQTGVYRFDSAMSVPSIVSRLVGGQREHQRLTIPEGKNRVWIAELLAEKGVCPRNEFLKASEGKEGYLFPDTYDLPPTTGAEEAAKQMLDNFALQMRKASLNPSKETCVVASMIELEARSPKDRPLIASVIYNRLKARMPLQIDATVLYALGKWKSRVTLEDLKVDSPFNTYRRAGLPPNPICNPGLESLKAAAHPAKTNYNYYVARGDGSHAFSAGYAEFLHNKRLLHARN